MLSKTRAVTAGQGAVVKTLAQLGLTHKKTIHAAEQERPDVAATRAEWRERQPELAAETLIFIDG